MAFITGESNLMYLFDSPPIPCTGSLGWLNAPSCIIPSRSRMPTSVIASSVIFFSMAGWFSAFSISIRCFSVIWSIP